jgi:hypothetical protein
MVESRQGSREEPIVVLTPYFTEGYRAVKAGITVLRTWDGTDLLGKCLWSSEPLVASVEPVVPDEMAPELERLWDREIGRDFAVLPTAGEEPGRNVSG